LAGTLDTTATVTIAQDSTTALTNVKAFVTAYNDAMAWVIENTKVDAATKTRGVFAGDSAITAMQSKLRSAINSAASSISTTYKTLPSIGLSSGAVGSTVGTTNTLPFTIIGLQGGLINAGGYGGQGNGSDNSTAYNNVIVTFNQQAFRAGVTGV
jgi:flagellar capping protein FliD